MKRFLRENKWSESGFTLVELMLTMAIIIILGSVAVVSASAIVRNIRQAASDKVAESLYTAVTAHLQEVWAFEPDEVVKLQSDSAPKAIGVSDSLDIRYVAKGVGDSPLVNADNLNIVLGVDGSAVGADYYGDSIIVEYNPSSLQVHSVFYSSSVAPTEYYKSGGSVNNSLVDLRSDVSKRKDEFNGYLGYYEADTQNLPELTGSEYFVKAGLESKYSGDPVRHFRNMDELTAPIRVYIPNEENENIKKLRFDVTISGKDSKASAKISYDEQDASTGGILQNYAATMLRTSDSFADSRMVAFEILLDNLKEGSFKDLFCTDTAVSRKTAIRFIGMTTGVDPKPFILERQLPVQLIPASGGKLFTPGEDLEVKVSAISVDGTEVRISDESLNYAVDNSIFAYGSGKKTDSADYYAAYLAYGRHLQNLSTDVSGMSSGIEGVLPVRAYQVDDIDFTKKESHLWAEIYNDEGKKNPYDSIMPFAPINNSHISAFYGDYVLSYNAGSSSISASSKHSAGYAGKTEYSINGLVVRSTTEKTVDKAGLFADFKGSEIKNITLSSPRISGSGVTGGLIATLSLGKGRSLTIENCTLYMTDEYCTTYYENGTDFGIVEKGDSSSDPDIQDDSDVTGLWMSGKTHAGGLIGEFTCPDTSAGDRPVLTIVNSHASTVIDTTDPNNGTSGGLIGFAGIEGSGSTVSVDLQKCYADSYIYGTDTGGLIGRIGTSSIVNMENVYTAGFQKGAIQAGFANGTISSVNSSYAYTQMDVGRDSTVFSTAARINDTDNKVYYFPQTKADSGNIGRITDLDNTTNIDNITSTGNFKTKGELLLSILGNGVNDPQNAFELDPGDTAPYNLRDGMALSVYSKPRLKKLIHYGDWEEDFAPGALCYYEQYKKANSETRFYGGNFNALYDNLEDGSAVKADGYGLVFKKDDQINPVPDMAKIKFYFAGTGESPVEYDMPLGKEDLESDYNDNTYLIYKLPNEYVNYVLKVDSAFYTKVEVTYVKDGSETGTDVFYFNPHFARAVGYLGRKDVSSGSDFTVPELRTNSVVYVRSARHLYNMSLYYKYYRSSTEGRNYRQTYDISYKDYDWHGYFNSSIPEGSFIYRQNPIGLTPQESFKAKYNGGCYKIRDISFALEKTDEITGKTYYTGLFGYNEGSLSNIVLFSDYDDFDSAAANVDKAEKKHYYAENGSKLYYFAGTDFDISKNSTLYLGILTGKNTGNISNCAVAGYCMADSRGTIVGNSNGYIYAGGLAGENSGTISDSSADTPQIRLTTTYTTAYIGGFAGRNTGTVKNSYSLGHIEVINPRGGSIALAGFAAGNSGEISSSYSAYNILAAGNSTVNAFAPQGGSVRDCYYLNNGTYSYVGHLYTYNYSAEKGAGTGKSRSELIALAKKSHEVKTGNSEDYPAYKVENEDYPYRAVVKDASNKYIHYGDWQRSPGMGGYGIFYWEEEKNGGNAGYHFSYVGVDEDQKIDIAGSTLCNAHDDKGKIVDYGYGYYVKKGSESLVTSEVTGLSVPDPGLLSGGLPTKFLSDEAEKLQKEAPDYTFYPYRTLKANSNAYDDYLYLSYGANEIIDDSEAKTINGKWKLKKGDNSTLFYVAPFFANAMSIVKPDVNQPAAEVVSQDGVNKTNYEVAPGKSTNNPYEIRTVEQLQYINWNAYKKNVSSIATADPNVYKAFPYLAYASETGVSKQTKAAAGHNWSLEFLQTHDVSGLDKDGKAVIPNYTPIAASQSANNVGTHYDATLYAWFGSNYDGQSYKISNISISSQAFSVGVFGVTVSAGLDNIILYSDSDCVIERNNGTDMSIGGYNIGGLVGIAYKYADSTGLIYNCAVAGYKIKDQSTNQQTVGGGNVGGLVGATTVDVKNCSAVTDIEINCTHAHNPVLTGDYNCGHSYFGDYVRTGGLVGALPGAATNCYSGGTIRVSDATLAESRRQDGTVIAQAEEEGVVCERKYSTNVYIGGISGSAYTMNYQNFTNKTQPNDGSPTLTNCYTYLDFPELRGSIRSITMIASLADRYGNESLVDSLRVHTSNCHYLNKFDRKKVANAAKYIIKSDNGHTAKMSPWEALNEMTNYEFNDNTMADETFFDNMLRGGGAYCSRITGYNNARIKSENTKDIDVHPSPESFDQLAGNGSVNVYNKTTRVYDTYENIRVALNANKEYEKDKFEEVTTTQPNGANIDGKYSFPGNNKALDGLNYPFPTIVKQWDIVFSRWVNVHYGIWPLSGMYWSEARSEMDIFGDQSANGFAYKELEILEPGDTVVTPELINMEEKGIVEVVSVEKVGGKYKVKFKALKTGTETITVGTAKLILEVKANFFVSTNPGSVSLAKGASQKLELHANAFSTSDASTEATATKDYSKKAAWTVTVKDNGQKHVGYIDGVQSQYEKSYSVGSNESTIYGLNPGKAQIVVKAVLKYNGKIYSNSLYLPMQTFGVIGLSNHGLDTAAGTNGFRNEISRGLEGTRTGDNSSDFGNSAPVMTDDGWSDLYLYESYADETLGKATITKITINGSEISVTDDGSQLTYSANGYTMDIGKVSERMSADENYRYRSLKLRPASGSKGGQVTVSVNLKDGETEASYVLAGSLTITHVVTLDVNKPVKSSETPVLSKKAVHAGTSGSADLSGASLTPTLTGYKFNGWSESAGGAAAYCTGSGNNTNHTISITDDKTLYAVWEPVKYTIIFDPGDGTLKTAGDNLADIADVEYDATVNLPAKAAVDEKFAHSNSEFNFVGWNTISDGSGISYKPGAEVTNLTDKAGETITLYAQWRDYNKLTFIDFKDGTVDPFRKQVKVSAGENSYQINESDGLIIGASKKTINGVAGYYWTSSKGVIYRLVGWDANRRKPAASVTYKITGSSASLPTITEIEGDSTFYAIWEEQSYSIRLMDAFTGTALLYQSYQNLAGGITKLGDITGYTPPVHTGYVFEGWYTKRISEGGEQLADSVGLLKEGKSISELIPDSDSITLYARYSEEIYKAVIPNEVTNGECLIAINERVGKTGRDGKPRNYTYLLSSNGNTLVGVKHTIGKCEKFYSDESGGSTLIGDNVYYVDEYSTPLKDNDPNAGGGNIVERAISANTVWTWTADNNLDQILIRKGTFVNNGKYLTKNTDTVILDNPVSIWTYLQISDVYGGARYSIRYYPDNSAKPYYALARSYASFKLNNSSDNYESAYIYMKTRIYLDEAPRE